MGTRTPNSFASAPGRGSALTNDAFKAAMELLEDSAVFAPQVLMRLLERLQGDIDAVQQYAAHLSPAHRRGFRALPDHLPEVAAVSIVGRWHDFSASEADVLLLAALAIVPDLDVLSRAAQISVADLADGPLACHLVLAGGHFSFADARLAIAVCSKASAADRVAAHSRLAEAFRSGERADLSAWHATEATGEYRADLGAILLETARTRSGDDIAFRFARRAVEHTAGHERTEAAVIAGKLAIHAGYLDDAVDILADAAVAEQRENQSAAPDTRLLGQLLIAQTLAEGAPPVHEPALHRPRSADSEQWRSWAETSGVTAVLCAERGLRAESRAWLAEVREADRRAGVQGSIRDPAVALSTLLCHEKLGADDRRSAAELGVIFHALDDALSGDVDSGLRRLVTAHGPLASEGDALLATMMASSLVSAYRSVLESLLRFWRGDAVESRRVLMEASTRLPVSLPFAGVGVILARRLDLVIDGKVGPFARAMTAALPPATPLDLQVDRAIEFYLRGQIDAAAVEMRLWLDRGAQQSVLYVPGLEELIPDSVSVDTGPPDYTTAAELLRRVHTSPEQNWRVEHPRLAEEARSIRSAFARARVEAALGTQSAIRGDQTSARQHLIAARSLFADAGATAWSDSVESRLARLSERWQAPGMPIAVIELNDPLALCRVAWSERLTPRELDAAMLVVEGNSNREISLQLRVSVRTVEVHLGRVFTKLGVRGRVELTVLAHRTGQHL